MLYIMSLVIKVMKNVSIRVGYISSRNTAEEMVELCFLCGTDVNT
jgi:hypothetical protein